MITQSNLLKGKYVYRNYLTSRARSNVDWRNPRLAPQQELGLLPERRAGLGSRHSARPSSTG
jgi:hypothetical protein